MNSISGSASRLTSRSTLSHAPYEISSAWIVIGPSHVAT
jgi:hypothetical protein